MSKQSTLNKITFIFFIFIFLAVIHLLGNIVYLEEQLEEIQQKDYTVICKKAYQREVTMNYEGYDCIILGNSDEI